MAIAMQRHAHFNQLAVCPEPFKSFGQATSQFMEDFRAPSQHIPASHPVRADPVDTPGGVSGTAGKWVDPGWEVLESDWEPLLVGIFLSQGTHGKSSEVCTLGNMHFYRECLGKALEQRGAGMQDAVPVPRNCTLQALQGLCPHSKSHLAYLDSSAARPHSLCPHPNLRHRRPRSAGRSFMARPSSGDGGHKVVRTGHDSSSPQSCAVGCACSTHCTRVSGRR